MVRFLQLLHKRGVGLTHCVLHLRQYRLQLPLLQAKQLVMGVHFRELWEW